jgi:hypothetical protein
VTTTRLAATIVDFKIGISESSGRLHPLALVIPWGEVVIAILSLFPLRWAVLTIGAMLVRCGFASTAVCFS